MSPYARWIGWRNRCIADPRFRRMAFAWPGLRWIARRKARRCFDLVTGFVHSQTLAAFVTLGWHKRLMRPASVEELAYETDLSADAVERLLLAGESVGLCERVGGGWTLGETGAAVAGDDGIAAMVAHHALLYADLADPVAALRARGGGKLASHWRYAAVPGVGEADEVAGYSRLMAASQPMVSDAILSAYDFGRHARVLDIGGGEGAFAAAIARRYPATAIGVFDLPAVVDRAGSTGIARHGGDFLRDELPRGYEVATLVRILHDHEDAAVERLLRAVHAALPRNGRIVVAEPMADTRGAEAMGRGYFGWYLWAMGSGRPRSARELKRMLHDAGFGRVCEHRSTLPLVVRVLSGERP
jgi:demethylspheroidene O-methyltransferase